jgi:hypothetical protein
MTVVVAFLVLALLARLAYRCGRRCAPLLGKYGLSSRVSGPVFIIVALQTPGGAGPNPAPPGPTTDADYLKWIEANW